MTPRPSTLTRRPRARLLPALVVAFLPMALAAQAAQPASGRAMRLEDWYRVTQVSQPAMSPDGKLVAMTVTTIPDGQNRRHQEVWVVPTAGGPAVRYTSPSTESSSPRFTPDGKFLLFTSNRPGGRGNTWALRMDAPGGEAAQFETIPSGSMPISGAFAIFTGPARGDTAAPRANDPYARMQATARPPFGAITRPLDPTRFDGRHYVETPIKSNGRDYIANPREAWVSRPQQLWRQHMGDTARTMLTSTAYSHRSPVVSPDGRFIAFVADAALRPDSVVQAEQDSLAKLPFSMERDREVRNDADIYVVPVAGGTPRKVAEWVGSESDLTWSPDGRQLAFVGRAGRTTSARLFVVDANGGTPRNVIGDFQFEPEGMDWLPNGTLQFVASKGGSTAIYRADLTGRTAPREVLGGRRRMNGVTYDAAGRTMAFVATSLSRPTELFIANADGTGERQLTTFNDALNREVAWSDGERFTFDGIGGLEIEGWMLKPYGYEPGKQYPLVLYIHGGPHSAYGENWFDEFQNLAAQGMWVLFTNPRGSSGYGADFTYSTRGRWFAEDYDDLMRAVDIAAKRPDVDSTRMGVTGGSYGGVMTAWVTVKTNRFKAAQADRMISNWWSWYGSSDAQGLTEFEFYGMPWENPAMYDTLSPIRYLPKVTTPTLIVQSEEDHRTPMTDAEQWFLGLKKHGVPAEFVRYPRSTHDLSRTGEPWLLVDRLGRLRQWFAYWLQDVQPTDPAPTRANAAGTR
jgi:dipeptidyl aminopeptidase/acylaminoacyl peptidase